MKLLASSTFRREPAAVPTARAFVSRTLGPLTLGRDAADRLVLAAAEAFNNVVLHADGDAFTVTLAVEGDSCIVSVSDTGQGFIAPVSRPAMPPADEINSRGLALMYALVDKVDVVSTARGTAVVLAQALPAPEPQVALPGRGGP